MEREGQLSISVEETDDGMLVSVSGEVDVSCADELRDAIDEAFEESMFIEVDLSDVAYIDSTGIGVLVGAAHRAAEDDTTFVVSNPQRNVARVLTLLGVDEELGLEMDEEE